jgi:hypothetical protein
MGKALVFILVFFVFNSTVKAQDSALITNSNRQLPSKYFDKIASQSNALQQKLDKKSKKTLAQLQKQEARMKKKLSKTDSSAAKNIFANADEKYKELEQRLKNSPFKQYIPGLDTVSTSLKFLQQNPELLSQTKEVKEKLADAMNKVKDLESQLQKAEDLKQFLRERRDFLKQQLSKFGFAKELKKLNKQAYYYSQQINDCKAIINDPKKIERKAIELLSRTKLFKDFMQKNSMLAALFPMLDPNDPNYAASLSGLQTRASVQQLIQNQLAAGGPNGQQQLQANLQQAQSQLQQLKDKATKWGTGSSEDILPEGFRPSSQKTKSFLQRLELGTNIQSQKSTSFFPVTSDVGLSLNYKINDNSLIGIGASYKLGWGSGWNNIDLSYQGIGLRSFIDWKLKGSFYISGGYEQNYKAEIRNIDQLRNFSAWQQSGLIGMSKVVSIKSKLFKRTKIQLLWDFLSYEQIPRGQPILFRVGYNFK